MFFVQARIGMVANQTQDLDKDFENIQSSDKNKETRKRNDNGAKASSQQKVSSFFAGEQAARLTNPSLPSAKSDSSSAQANSKVVLLDDENGFHPKYIEVESDNEDLR